MGISGMGRAEGLAQVLNGMFEHIDDQQGTMGVSDVKFSSVDPANGALSVTYVDAGGETRTVEVPEIDLPSGEPTREAVLDVLARLDALSDDISITDKGMEGLGEIAERYISKLESKLVNSPIINSNFSVFDIIQEVLYLIIECANEEAKSAQAARNAAHLQEYAATLAMAETQKANAIAGLVASVVSCALQVAVTAVTSVCGSINKIKADNGVKTALNNFNNAEQIGNPVKAEAAMNGTAAKLKIPETDANLAKQVIMGGSSEEAKVALNDFQTDGRAQVQTELEGKLASAMADLSEAKNYLEELQDPSANAKPGEIKAAEAKVADLEKQVQDCRTEIKDYAESSVSQEQKLKQGVKVAEARENLERVANGETVQVTVDGKTKTLTLKDAQEAYRAEVDKAVDLYRGDADRARAEYMAVRDNPQSTKAEIKAAHAKLVKAQNAYQYASAVRTNALSQYTANGMPVISESGIAAEIADRKAEFAAARNAAHNDPAMEKATSGLGPSETRELVSQICRGIEGVTQSALKILDADVTRMGAEKSKSEMDAESANELLQMARKLLEDVLKLLDALNASIRNSNMA